MEEAADTGLTKRKKQKTPKKSAKQELSTKKSILLTLTHA